MLWVLKKEMDQRLDFLFKKIEIKHKEQEVAQVENMTYDAIKGISSPQLRLKKPAELQ